MRLVELRTVKKRWSEEFNAYFDQKHYITITEKQFMKFADAVQRVAIDLQELSLVET